MWIDISWFNGSVDLSGLEGVMIRATDGTGIDAEGLKDSVDLNLVANVSAARAAGISVGFYGVLEDQAVPAQVSTFLDAIAPYKAPGDILAVDVEHGQLGTERAWPLTEEWLATVGPALVYANQSTLASFGVMPTYLWLAAITDAPPKPCVLWQNGQTTIGGKVVDTDQMLASAAELQQLGGIEPITLAAPPVAILSSGHGYLVIAEDGGTFASGTPWYGSTYSQGFTGLGGDKPLDARIVGGALTSSGYYLVGEDGGVFAFGTAPFLGSAYLKGYTGLGGDKPCKCVGMTTASGGYFLQLEDGTSLGFGVTPGMELAYP